MNPENDRSFNYRQEYNGGEIKYCLAIDYRDYRNLNKGYIR